MSPPIEPSSGTGVSLGVVQAIVGLIVAKISWLWVRINRHQQLLEEIRENAHKADMRIKDDMNRSNIKLAVVEENTKNIKDKIDQLNGKLENLIKDK